MVDRTLTLIQDDGTEILADILFTYHKDETNKDYVVFMVRETQEVSAACYNPANGGEGALGAIETEEEWKMLEDLLADYANQQYDEEGCASCGGGCGGCGSSCDCGGSCGGCSTEEE